STWRTAVGVIGLYSYRRDGPLLTPKHQRLLDALAAQAALAIDRLQLVASVALARLSSASSLLLSALLPSLSPALPPPL
ncbi:hypothetical protein ACC704_38240, partial [Rhizobium johnstonii]|uniref:hypothetical protein n=1 Tax=Rhizobium johnstonii TaxID=3019933 RepID=UPI003F96C645